MDKLDCCIQGQGHSKISKCQWMFYPDNIFWIAEPSTTKLDMVRHHEPDCLPKWLLCCLEGQWFAILKGKVTVMNNLMKIWLSDILSELLILLKLNLVWWHIIIRWIVLWKDCGQCLGHRKKFRISVNVHLNDISSVAEPSVAKLDVVMQHHGPKYHARGLVCCLEVLLNCWSLCNQI